MLKARDIVFAYNKRLKPVINGLDVTIEPGKVYGFLGRNGSGKTTMLKVLNGLHIPQEGVVTVDSSNEDREYNVHKDAKADIAREIGFVPQESRGVFPYQVLEMVVMGRNPHLSYLQRPSARDYEIAYEALKEIEIEYLWDKDFMEISGGERQLVLIARVIAQGARYLILDEPTSHLDFKNQYQIMELVKRVSLERNVATIMAIHDPNLAITFADYILMLKHGKLMAEGPTDEIMTEENLSDLYEMKITLKHVEGEKPFVLGAI